MKQNLVNKTTAFVIPIERESKETSPPYSVVAKRDDLIKNYWGKAPEPTQVIISPNEYKSNPGTPLWISIANFKQIYTDPTKMTVKVKANVLTDNKNVVIEAKPYLDGDVRAAENGTITDYYYFVIEKQFIERRIASDLDPDGIEFSNENNPSKDLLITLGNEMQNDGTFIHYIIINAGEWNGTKFKLFKRFTGAAGGEPPGVGLKVPSGGG
jgi:hypothetical protein